MIFITQHDILALWQTYLSDPASKIKLQMTFYLKIVQPYNNHMSFYRDLKPSIFGKFMLLVNWSNDLLFYNNHLIVLIFLFIVVILAISIALFSYFLVVQKHKCINSLCMDSDVSKDTSNIKVSSAAVSTVKKGNSDEESLGDVFICKGEDGYNEAFWRKSKTGTLPYNVLGHQYVAFGYDINEEHEPPYYYSPSTGIPDIDRDCTS